LYIGKANPTGLALLSMTPSVGAICTVSGPLPSPIGPQSRNVIGFPARLQERMSI